MFRRPLSCSKVSFVKSTMMCFGPVRTVSTSERDEVMTIIISRLRTTTRIRKHARHESQLGNRNPSTTSVSCTRSVIVRTRTVVRCLFSRNGFQHALRINRVPWTKITIKNNRSPRYILFGLVVKRARVSRPNGFQTVVDTSNDFVLSRLLCASDPIRTDANLARSAISTLCTTTRIRDEYSRVI